ncbi:MAG: 3-isopropylmalate dehydratase small subunit [Polyangiales bacterium]
MSFQKIHSRVISLPVDDVDTDQIIPARFLKVTSKDGLGDALFADWRAEGKPASHLAKEKGAEILLAGRNFACGSSREHAPWALRGFGFRAVVASSFADIFRNNALKNGLLPVEIDAAALATLHAARAKDRDLLVTIDLDAQLLVAAGVTARFAVDPFAKKCLREGIDELGYLLSHLPEIESYEARRDV